MSTVSFSAWIRIHDVTVHYAEHGSGPPLVALHGAGVDHREIEAAIETVLPGAPQRRIYPDLPGMGRTTADGVRGNDGVVCLLVKFIDRLEAGPVMLLGHSYGAYLARGVAARRPDSVLGLALVCPLAETSGDLPAHEVVRGADDAYDELESSQRAGFDEYFVVRTAATARRYRDCVVPGTEAVDGPALERIFADWTIDLAAAAPFEGPTAIVAGRHDSVVGYRDATQLLGRYPRAGLTVIEGAGHALMHERPDLFAAVLDDWLERGAGARP